MATRTIGGFTQEWDGLCWVPPFPAHSLNELAIRTEQDVSIRVLKALATKAGIGKDGEVNAAFAEVIAYTAQSEELPNMSTFREKLHEAMDVLLTRLRCKNQKP